VALCGSPALARLAHPTGGVGEGVERELVLGTTRASLMKGSEVPQPGRPGRGPQVRQQRKPSTPGDPCCDPCVPEESPEQKRMVSRQREVARSPINYILSILGVV
jgi:hypothetical protein